MSEYIVKGAEPNETVLHTRTPNGYEEWRWLPVREEIVRCRDCRHYVPEYGYSEERGFGQIEYLIEPPACARSKVIEITVDPNGFCAWGERRDA